MKKIILATLVLVTSISLVACNAGVNESVSTKKEVNLEEVSTKLTESEYIKVEGKELQKVDIKDYSVEQLDNVKDKIEQGFILQDPLITNLREIIVLKTTDVESVKTALKDMIDNDFKYMQFASGYGSEENAVKVKQSKLDSVGDFVYFIAIEDSETVEKELRSLLQ